MHLPTNSPVASGSYSLDDLTLIVGVRLSHENPWIVERLELLSRHYGSLPRVIVVDQGSKRDHAAQLQALCIKLGFTYTGEEDDEPYSPARAKNLGASLAKTPLLFFSDADFFGEPGLFDRLVHVANQLDFASYLDQLLTLPIYHLSEAASARVLSAPSSGDELAKTLAACVYSRRGDETEFIAPYSNCFLCRRDFYDLLGGQNERFRQHGSEDFEFLLRVAVHTGQFPLPSHPQENVYGPTQHSFLGPKPFRGFRRLFELMGFQAEVLGLRVAHLHHPRPQPGQSWYRKYEAKRAAFERETAPYLRDPAQLIAYDFMPRDKLAFVRPKNAAQADLLTLLRMLGYRLSNAGNPDAMRATHANVIQANIGTTGLESLPPSTKCADIPIVTFTPQPQMGTYRVVNLPESTAPLLIRSFETRPAGGKAPIRLCAQQFGESRWRRVALDRSLHPTSYASARLSIGQELLNRGALRLDTAGARQRLKKLFDSPRAFFQDSRFTILRELERRTRPPSDS